MTFKNADMPAMPVIDSNGCSMRYGPEDLFADGLTKRETFCLHMGVAETGDAELDAIIRKGNQQKMVMHMMSARVSITGAPDYQFNAKRAAAATSALIAELERTK